MEVVAADCGVSILQVLDLTFRDCFTILEAQQKRSTRQMQVATFAAWQNQNLSRHKRLPNLADLLRKLEPARVMSAKAIRGAIMNMAKAMGAEVRYVKKKDR